MTSGVKQALPQVLMPAGEGKPGRNRAPQGNFAETLGIGRLTKQLQPSEPKADRHEIEVRPAWPRLAEKLGSAIDRTPGTVSRLGVAHSPLNDETDETADDQLTASKDSNFEDSVPPPGIARNAAEPAQPAGATAPFAAQAAAIETKQAGSTQPTESAAGGELSAPIALDAGEPDTATVSRDKQTSGKAAPAQPSFVPMGSSEHGEPTRFEPASKPTIISKETSAFAANEAKETPPDTVVEPARTSPRLVVLAQQNIPAPTPSTAVVLVETMAASGLLEPAANRLAVDAIHASATHASARSLKIQLHPAELGMVTATLRFAGEQLSIELQVENHEAYRRLSSDSEAIVKSLRDLGYDIERVSVLQPSIASSAAARSDGAAMQTPQGRAGDQFGSGATGGGNSGAGGRQPGTDGGNAGHGGRAHPHAGAEQSANGGVYI